MPVSNISIGNKALAFIDKRVQDVHYRGSRSSQHNRYTMAQIVVILELLNKYSPANNLMVIRTADISKRPHNTPDEFTYAQFCHEAKEMAGIGTQDAMRKNLFVDLHRMGFIERYDKKKKIIDPYANNKVKYVCLSTQGSKLISANNIVNKYFIFSKGIDSLLGGFIELVLNIIKDIDYGIDSISIYEFMFFVSAIGTETLYNITVGEAVELIKEFRVLTPIQRKSVIETLKKELNPSKFSGNKITKRDYHNWHNKAAQVFYLLNQTVYFEVQNNILVLKQVNRKSLKEYSRRLDRSLTEKHLYFHKHGQKKVLGFELHHVVPLAWSESWYHFKTLDKWENMLYIDAFSHAQITQNRNRNVKMDFRGDDITLSDFSDNQIYLRSQRNIAYNTKNKTILKNYNSDLLNTVNPS